MYTTAPYRKSLRNNSCSACRTCLMSAFCTCYPHSAACEGNHLTALSESPATFPLHPKTLRQRLLCICSPLLHNWLMPLIAGWVHWSCYTCMCSHSSWQWESHSKLDGKSSQAKVHEGAPEALVWVSSGVARKVDDPAHQVNHARDGCIYGKLQTCQQQKRQELHTR